MIKHVGSVNGLPSFDDVDDEELRAMNRGAILANLFEDYYECLGSCTYPYKRLVQDQRDYLNGLSPTCKQKAMDAMHIHLAKRGFKFGS